MAHVLHEHPANYFGIRLRKVKTAPSDVKVTASLQLEEAALTSHSGPPRPTLELMFMWMYMLRVGVHSDWLSPYSSCLYNSVTPASAVSGCVP